jgi:hypothetical protein
VESLGTRPVGYGAVACGNFKGSVSESDGLRIGVWGYARKAMSSSRVDRFARQLVETYSRAFAPYPFAELDIVEASGWAHGHAHTGMIFVGEEVFASKATLRRLNDSWSRFVRVGVSDMIVSTRGPEALLAHEVAHQWWGMGVRTAKREDRWLVEALSEYSAFLVVQNMEDDRGKSTYRQWKRMCKHSDGKGSPYMSWLLSGDGARRLSMELTYGRGPMALHAIAHEIGQDKLIEAMAELARCQRSGFADTEGFLEILDSVSGRDLSDLYNRWVKGVDLAELPPYEISGAERAGAQFRRISRWVP